MFPRPILRLLTLTATALLPLSLPAQSILFWAQNSNDRVLRANVDGSSVTNLTPTLTNPWGLDFDGTHVYFTEDQAGKIWRMDPDGGNRTLLVSGLSMPRDIVATATNLYWVNISGDVQRANLDGTGVTTLTNVGGAFLQGIEVTNSYIYLTNATSHSVQRANLDGSGVTTLVGTGLSIPYGIHATAQYLYWADLGNDLILRANLDGTGVTTLMSGIDINNPSDVLVTDSFLYFTQQNAGVYRANLDGSGIVALVTGGNDYRFIDGQVTAVPEPSTAALLAGAGGLGVVAWRRRRPA
jgi:sugar lactone lactonase YvrE